MTLRESSADRRGSTHIRRNDYTLHRKVCKKEYELKCPYSFCLFSIGVAPACHLYRSTPEIPPSLCSVLFRPCHPERSRNGGSNGTRYRSGSRTEKFDSATRRSERHGRDFRKPVRVNCVRPRTCNARPTGFILFWKDIVPPK